MVMILVLSNMDQCWLQYDANYISVIRMLVVKNILQFDGDSVFRDISGQQKN